MSIYMDKPPTTCECCPCNDDSYRCGATGEIFDSPWYMGRLASCPIKPLADVVEVVRCKDCRHRIYDGSRDLYYCEMYYGMGNVSDENYCSFGERAEE